MECASQVTEVKEKHSIMKRSKKLFFLSHFLVCNKNIVELQRKRDIYFYLENRRHTNELKLTRKMDEVLFLSSKTNCDNFPLKR